MIAPTRDCDDEDPEECVERILGDGASRETRLLARIIQRNLRQLYKRMDQQDNALQTHMDREEEYRGQIEAFHNEIKTTIGDFAKMVERGRGGLQMSIWIGGFVGFVWMIAQIAEKIVGLVRG